MAVFLILDFPGAVYLISLQIQYWEERSHVVRGVKEKKKNTF